MVLRGTAALIACAWLLCGSSVTHALELRLDASRGSAGNYVLQQVVTEHGYSVVCNCAACTGGVGTGATAGNYTTYGAGLDTSNLTAVSAGSASLGGFNIVINATPALLANTAAMASFERAAARWEAVISDPITVTIDADIRSFGVGNSNIIGQTNSIMLYDEFADEILTSWKAEAALDADDGIVASIPGTAALNATLPSGFTRNSALGSTKANLKAMNVPDDLDGIFGAADGSIEFNSDFSFDYDNSDGVAFTQVDFESAAMHEIGHMLGFVSAVDDIDYFISNPPTGSPPYSISPNPLDMFRFARTGLNDPTTLAEFVTIPREWRPGESAAFDMINGIADVPDEIRLSEGALNGDGRQASHWKDNNLTGMYVGAMDPTLSNGQIFQITNADLRALDLIGWDIVVTVPEPGTWILAALAALGFLLVAPRRNVRHRLE